MNIVKTQREVLTEVIKLYRSHRLLWDPNDPKYKNKPQRAKANQELLKVYQKIHPEATVDCMKKKLENLRTGFKSVYLKVKKAQANGNLYVPTLWYYDLLLFLEEPGVPRRLTDKPFIETKQNETYETDEIKVEEISEGENSNQGGEEEELECEILEEYDEAYTEASAPILIKTEAIRTPAKRPITKRPRQTTESEKQLKNINHCRAFGEAVGLQLQDLDLEQQYIAQKLISDVIFMARYKKLTVRSFLHTTSDHADKSEPLITVKIDPLNE